MIEHEIQINIINIYILDVKNKTFDLTCNCIVGFKIVGLCLNFLIAYTLIRAAFHTD